MPQTDITYDTPYLNSLRDKGKLMQNAQWRTAGNAYAPTDMGFKLSNFHNDYRQEPKASAMIGGGSPSPQKFMLNGNSPAYPPLSLSSGLAVSSGGSRYAGMDGAVGGYSFNDFIGDVAHVGKEVGPDVIRSMMAAGRRHPRRTRKGGSKVGDQIASVAKTLAPFAPLLLGLGRPLPKSKADVVDALKDLGAKKSHTLKKLKEIAMSGGYSFNDFLGDVAHVGKEVAPDLIRASLASGAGKRKRKSKKGGLSLSDVLESAKPAITKAVSMATPTVKRVAKDLGAQAIDALASKAKSVVASKVGSGGRAKRAEIVKKIMREKGMKMIEASKYVKAHNLY
jgi:hypothetical protein